MRRAALEACPEPLKPHLVAVEEARDHAVKAIARKNYEMVQLHNLERSLDVISNPADKEKRQAEIEETRAKSLELESSCEKLKEECRRIEKEYFDAIREHRIRNVPESRREAALALLQEEREALRTINTETSTDGRHVGTIGGTFFNLDWRVKEAEKRGDKEALAYLRPLLDKARADVEAVQTAAKARQEQSAEICRTYDARLQSLIDEADD
ncbi:hypothetical protein EON82_11535 [bacterium]|nr:MAG: hypothetical protein EON82_11535 [bacterium]